MIKTDDLKYHQHKPYYIDNGEQQNPENYGKWDFLGQLQNNIHILIASINKKTQITFKLSALALPQ